MFAWDVTRFGKWADKKFTQAQVADQYAKRFAIHFPNEERDAGRPVRTRPAHALQAALGGVFGLNYGWEHRAVVRRSRLAPKIQMASPGKIGLSPLAANVVCCAKRRGLSIFRISPNTAYWGEAAEWLNAFLPTPCPRPWGGLVLTPLIGVRGGLLVISP